MLSSSTECYYSDKINCIWPYYNNIIIVVINCGKINDCHRYILSCMTLYLEVRLYLTLCTYLATGNADLTRHICDCLTQRVEVCEPKLKDLNINLNVRILRFIKFGRNCLH